MPGRQFNYIHAIGIKRYAKMHIIFNSVTLKPYILQQVKVQIYKQRPRDR